jgi:hypothetical protein
MPRFSQFSAHKERNNETVIDAGEEGDLKINAEDSKYRMII